MEASVSEHRLVGRPGDFDFLVGCWDVCNRRLRERRVGDHDWVEFQSTCEARSLIGGIVSVDEVDVTSLGYSTCTVRALDLAMRRWWIHSVTSCTGAFDPPLAGGFCGDRGEFHGDDVDETGGLVCVRLIWMREPATAPRVERAFSVDGGVHWQTEWVMSFTRRRRGSLQPREPGG